MEPHARKYEASWQSEQREQLLDTLAQIEAEHGPVDPEAVARFRAQAITGARNIGVQVV